jgi:hypothetical protein
MLNIDPMNLLARSAARPATAVCYKETAAFPG